ncbi:MAG: hypothetical protein H6670_05940 [Anaerolineaceae bacterium]|nr:hypothetical protein [Anaerolineaceae bacterium]
MIDFGSFIQQILPIASLYVFIPALLLIAYLVIRSVRKRMKANTTSMSNTTSTTTTSAVRAPSALDLLAQAENDDRVSLTSDLLDDIDMPELGSLLDGMVSEPALASNNGHVKLSSGEAVKATSLIDVMRDEATGQLLVRMDGVGYYNLADEPEMKKTFKSIMTELSGVIMQTDHKAAKPSSKPAPVEAVAEEKPDLIDELRHNVYDDEYEEAIPDPEPEMFFSSSAPPPPIDREGHLPGDLPSFKLDDQQVNIESRGAFRKAKVTMDAPPELNIANAIDAYLQHKLRYTPEMDGQRIGIMPSLSGGVRIVVNGMSYDAVDEVAEPHVRAFIQQAIAEWQERQ